MTETPLYAQAIARADETHASLQDALRAWQISVLFQEDPLTRQELLWQTVCDRASSYEQACIELNRLSEETFRD